MNLKFLSAGAVVAGTLASAPAQALTFTYNEFVTGDLSNNSALPTIINSGNTAPPLPATGLPANSDALAVIGGFSSSDLNDYGQFTLGQAATAIDIVMNSSHLPPAGVVRELGFQFYQGGIGGTLLASGVFGTDGGDGSGPLPDGAFQQLLTGNFAPGIYSFRTFVNNTSVPVVGSIDYGFRVEAAQAVPTPALLPGLIGMGVATLRRRKVMVSEASEA
jgi:hypothetical protein